MPDVGELAQPACVLGIPGGESLAERQSFAEEWFRAGVVFALVKECAEVEEGRGQFLFPAPVLRFEPNERAIWFERLQRAKRVFKR